MNVRRLELFCFVAKHGGMTAWSGKRFFAELETKAQMQMRRMKSAKRHQSEVHRFVASRARADWFVRHCWQRNMVFLASNAGEKYFAFSAAFAWGNHTA